jgi:hypothetical protein
MAGRPKRRALIHELTKRAADNCEDGTAHLEYVLQWIEDGKTISQLAREISEDAKEDIFGSYITRYLADVYPEWPARVAAARAVGSHSMIDEARDIIDELDGHIPDKDRTAVAKARAEVRQWTAERYNRRELGAPVAGVSVSLSINTLHLDALRSRSATAKATAISGERDTSAPSVAHVYISDGTDTMAGQAANMAVVEDAEAIECAIVSEVEEPKLLSA